MVCLRCYYIGIHSLKVQTNSIKQGKRSIQLESKALTWCAMNWRKTLIEMNPDSIDFDATKYAGFIKPVMHPEVADRHYAFWVQIGSAGGEWCGDEENN
jgi:hypothetical protein